MKKIQRNQIKLKIKAKFLAEEAKIIKKEEQKLLRRIKSYYDDVEFRDYADIHLHRMDVVKTESRATHIARTFLAGKPFNTIEVPSNWYSKICHGRQERLFVLEKVARMLYAYHPEVTAQIDSARPTGAYGSPERRAAVSKLVKEQYLWPWIKESLDKAIEEAA